MKRFLTVLMVLLLASGFLFANGKGEKAASSASDNGEADNTYSMFMRSTYVDWISELKWYDEAEKRTGITVEYVKGPSDASGTFSEVDQRIISNTLPDATMVRLTQSNVYGPQGVFADLAPYIKKYAPNLQAYMDANPLYKKLVSDDNGAIYGLVKENPTYSSLIGYRADHFQAAGIDPESIVTVEDFTDALRTLKAFYGEGNRNYYPLCGRDSAFCFACFFGAAPTISMDASNGIYMNNHYKDGSADILNENAYTMVETMRTWYEEGLINPEWVAGTSGEADWESTVLNGNGSVFFDFYNRAEWFMDNGGPSVDPNFQMAIMSPLKDKNGNILKLENMAKYDEKYVTAVNANCSESKIKTILTFIDYFYSPEGITLANYGVEGESFKTNADGTKTFIADYRTEESKATGEKKWSFLSDRFTVCKPVDNHAFYAWNLELIKEATNRIFTKENLMDGYTIKFTAAQSKELANLVSTVYQSQLANMLQFVDGRKELTPASWKAFQDDMKAKGLTRIEELQLEAFRHTYGD